jgi:hypothetical protein
LCSLLWIGRFHQDGSTIFSSYSPEGKVARNLQAPQNMGKIGRVIYC